MRRAGITITHVQEYAIKSAADFKAAGWLFERARPVPNYDGYRAFAERIGQRGIAVALPSRPPHPCT